MMARATTGTTRWPQRKLALVIGIGDYKNVKKLTNPQNDAKKLSSLLRRIGFNKDEPQGIQPQLDKTWAEMKQILVAFEVSIQPNDMVLFYFAGHGTQWEDQNYLMLKDFPEVDEKNPKEIANILKRYAINAQDLLNTLTDRTAYVTIFLLDCCRTYVLRNPDLDTRAVNAGNYGSVGLRAMHRAGSLIAFACAPNTLIDDRPREQNSLFMDHLLKHIATPNEDILNILRDVTHGVMKDSQDKQIPFLSVQLRHKNIYVCEKAQVLRWGDINFELVWNNYGVSVVGGNGYGYELNQLDCPLGLFVDEKQMLYVADWNNHRIVQWRHGEDSGRVVAGGNGKGSADHQLYFPTDMIVDNSGQYLFICDTENRRVVRWPIRGGKVGDTIISGVHPHGLTMDKNGFLYICDFSKHEVRRWHVGDKQGELVAGGNGQGNRCDQLDRPVCVCVDQNHSVYVSDYGNHRVMKWMDGAKQGILAAGGRGSGNSLSQLSNPRGIVVDQLGTVFVADSGNNRIISWPREAKEGDLVVDGRGRRSQANELKAPIGLSFDKYGNIYVAEYENCRVQKFENATGLPL